MPTLHLDPPKVTARSGFRLPPAARYALAAIGFLVPSTWLLLLLACVKYGDTWPQTCEPVNYAAAALAVALLVAGSLGLTYLERARRRARKGMWQQSGPGWGKTLERSVRIAWGSEAEPPPVIAGEMRFERRRWTLHVRNGQRVHVDRRVFWLWLQQVEALAATLPPGQSPVSRRRWEGRVIEGQMIREGDLLAFCDILAAVGRFTYPRADVRSRQYVSGGGAACWAVCEEFEKAQRSEVY